MATWQARIDAFDAGYSVEVAAAATTALAAGGYTTPAAAAGMLEADLEANFEWPTGPARALVRRLVRGLVDEESAARSAALKASAPSSTQLGEGLGAVSALALAGLVSQPSTQPASTVDVQDMLKESGLKDIDFSMLPETSVFKLLQDSTKEALAAKRVPFAYVELTSKETLPPWLPLDALGGKMGEHHDWADAKDTPLGQLGAALKHAARAPRFFRTMAQWNGAFTRFLVAAVAAGQWTCAQGLAYVNVISSLVDKEQSAGRGPYLAFLYDEMLRRSVARRAEQCDPELVVAKQLVTVQKPILEQAEQRLSTVLAYAGITTRSMASSSRDGDADVSRARAETAAAGALSKQTAAAQAAQKKAEAASKALSRQQEEMLQRADAIASRSRSPPKGRGRGRGQQQRDERRKNWSRNHNKNEKGNYSRKRW